LRVGEFKNSGVQELESWELVSIKKTSPLLFIYEEGAWKEVI